MSVTCEAHENRRREGRTFMGAIENFIYASTATPSDVFKVKNAIAESAYQVTESYIRNVAVCNCITLMFVLQEFCVCLCLCLCYFNLRTVFFNSLRQIMTSKILSLTNIKKYDIESNKGV